MMLSVSSLIVTNGQGGAERISHPSLEAVRAHLLEVIRNKPVPQPQPTLFDVRQWQRNSRRLTAAQYLRSIPDTTNIATVIGVTSRCVNYWRRGEHAPSARHWRKLRALRAIVPQVTS